MQKEAMTKARLGDLAIQVTDTASFIHAFFSFGFGISLIVSAFMDRDSDSPSYQYLRDIPGWPGTLGVVMVVSGFLLFGGTLLRLVNCRFHLRVVGYGLQALTMTTYCVLFFLGSLTTDRVIFGPQWTYGVIAALACLRAYHSARAIRIMAGG